MAIVSAITERAVPVAPAPTPAPTAAPQPQAPAKPATLRTTRAGRDEAIIGRYTAGDSVRAIKDTMGVSSARIYGALERGGVSRRRGTYAPRRSAPGSVPPGATPG